MQVEIFPDQLSNIETAQALLNEPNKISGITRMIMYGPRLPSEDPENLLAGKHNIREPKYLNIMGKKVELTVQAGRIFVEMDDPGIKEKINEACRKVLPLPFKINEGIYTYVRKR